VVQQNEGDRDRTQTLDIGAEASGAIDDLTHVVLSR
jgi:hypothetical protein